MKMNRRHFLKANVLSTITALGLVSGCNPPADNANKILVGVTARPRMLDPRKATDALSSRVNRLLYRQLIDFNDAFEPVPDLASWEMLSDTHYRFTLNHFPTFHHGPKLSAHDVVATYVSILDKNLGSPHRGSLKGIQSVTAKNDRVIDFKLLKPDALFVGRLVIGILPADKIKSGHSFTEHPIGAGEAQFVSMTEQRLILKRKDGITLHFIPVKDANVRVLKLRKGELDIIQNDLSPELVNYCDNNEALKLVWTHGTNFGYIGFNFDDPDVGQLALRQAIAYGINRQEIIDAMFDGHARLAGGLLVPEHWAGVQGLTGVEYNPEKAKELLKTIQKSPGLVNSDGLIELSYKTSSNPTRIRLATIYQSQLKKIGIHLKVQSYDWGTFYSDIKQGRFQLYSLAWVGIKSPDIFQYVFDSEAIPPKGANRGRYRDDLADQLIRDAGKSNDIAEQARLYQQLQVHLQDTLAALPLWYEDQYAVMRNNISGFTMYSDGRLDGLLRVKKGIL